MRIFISKILRKKNGALTVEAAIVLPIFICAILTIGFLTRIVYTHEIIQHAIDEAANRMASDSYIYYISGIYEVDDTLSSQLEERQKKLDIFMDISNGSNSEMIGLASFMAKTQLDKGKTGLGNIVIEQYIKKIGLTDERLRSLCIDKLDFSHSSYFNNSQDVDVIVKYNINNPLPIKFLSHITIVQRATVRAWMGGEYDTLVLGTDDKDNGLDSKERTVYVSKKGSKYHLYGCYSIFKEVEALDLSDAKKLGLESCKKCKPPIVSSDKYIVFKSKRSPDGKYHREGCIHLFKDIIEMDIEEASKKYEPCKICKPPSP